MDGYSDQIQTKTAHEHHPISQFISPARGGGGGGTPPPSAGGVCTIQTLFTHNEWSLKTVAHKVVILTLHQSHTSTHTHAKLRKHTHTDQHAPNPERKPQQQDTHWKLTGQERTYNYPVIFATIFYVTMSIIIGLYKNHEHLEHR